jgi:hypothetical protein
MQPNIYSNYDDECMESIKDSKELVINEVKTKNDQENNINNIYQNESHKINDEIINNININKNIIIKNNKKINL